jgi:hypothetical protein
MHFLRRRTRLRSVSCVLRAVGAEFEVDAFLRCSRLSPLKVWRRGERLGSRSGPEQVLIEHDAPEKKYGQSGFAVVASAASFRDPVRQASDATYFLRRHEPALAQLAHCPGVEAILLDFGIEDRPVEQQTNYFPPELLNLMGRLNIGLVVTRYPETAD